MPDGRVRSNHFPEGTLPTFVVLGININGKIVDVVFPKNFVAWKFVGCCWQFALSSLYVSYWAIKHVFLACTRNIVIVPHHMSYGIIVNSENALTMIEDLQFCSVA